MRTSYGFTQNEEYEKDALEAHRDEKVEPSRDNVDGLYYVKDCVQYFTQKVRELSP